MKYILYDTQWGSQSKRALIEAATVSIMVFRQISVRHIKKAFRHTAEILKNPDFGSLDGWTLSPATVYDRQQKALLVSIKALATRVISVEPVMGYQNKVRVRCHNGQAGQGRMQINWLDKAGQFIKVDIKVFDCTNDWRDHTMTVVSPPGAATAFVYTSGHTGTILEYAMNSLRK